MFLTDSERQRFIAYLNQEVMAVKAKARELAGCCISYQADGSYDLSYAEAARIVAARLASIETITVNK